MIRLRSEGRGRSYSVLRGVVESSLRILYKGGWPAVLWGNVPGACEVDCVVHRIPLLPRGEKSVRIGFISDLHLGPTTPSRLLDNAFAHLSRANLDVLLLGGDYVFLDATEKQASELASRIQAVPARRKLAVLGNHDLWTHHEIIEQALVGAGVGFLTNRNDTLDPAHPGTRVVGLDDPWTGKLDAGLAFNGTSGARALVVLCHSPDGLPAAQKALLNMVPMPDVLYVCGHTHGGHIATPWGPLIVPGRMGKRYPSGLYEVGPIKLYVSRGVGGIELPIRAYAKPEVAVFELTAKG